jgi:hypothetical protein
LFVIVVVGCGGGGGERRVAGCGCGGCFPWVSHGTMYSMPCTKIMWPVGIVGKCVIWLGTGKSRVRLSLDSKPVSNSIIKSEGTHNV